MKAVIAAAIAMVVALTVAQAQSQMELNQQAAEEFRKADRQLNRVYTDLMARISAPGKAKLRQAQITWLGFRDQECEFETMGTSGGSIHGMMLTGCRTRLTIQRVADLERLLNCQEGDLSCAGL